MIATIVCIDDLHPDTTISSPTSLASISMSHNGIGLQTPRGSGTSGYVQKSLSERRNEGFRHKREREADEENRKQAKLRIQTARKGAGAEITAHNRKRWIELKCLELRDDLEDQDVDDEEIEEKVKALRVKLTKHENKESNKESNKENGNEDTKEGSGNKANNGNGETEEGGEEARNGTSSLVLPTDKHETSGDFPTTEGSQLSYNYVPRYTDR